MILSLLALAAAPVAVPATPPPRCRSSVSPHIIVQGGISPNAASRAAAAGRPKPDNPSDKLALGPKQDDPSGMLAIGPKQDDPAQPKPGGPGDPAMPGAAACAAVPH